MVLMDFEMVLMGFEKVLMGFEKVLMGFEMVQMDFEMVMIQLWSSILDHHMKYCSNIPPLIHMHDMYPKMQMCT